MPFIDAPEALAAFTANGGTDGYVTVADATPFYPGAFVWIRSATVEPKQYEVTDIAAGNKIGVREVLSRDGGQRYGRTPVNQFLTADSATIAQERGPVRVELAYNKVSNP